MTDENEIPLAIKRLTEEEVEKFIKILEYHEDLIAIAKKRRGFNTVGEYIKRAALFIVPVVAAISVGYDGIVTWIQSIISS